MAEFLTKGSCRHWRYLFYVYLFLYNFVIIRVITDYRPNWTPRGPITAINQKYNKILERDWFSPARFKHW